MVVRPWFHKMLAALVAVVCIALGLSGQWHRKHDLPYSDHFATQQAEEWFALGGTWSFKNGAVINRSDERGAKLLVGSEDWKDYELHADLQVLGTAGDAGIIARVKDATEGINGYSGYYAGLQLRDGALILGSSHDDWVAVPPVALPGGVRPGSWYSLDIVAVGCTIGCPRATPTKWARGMDRAQAAAVLEQRTRWSAIGWTRRRMEKYSCALRL